MAVLYRQRAGSPTGISYTIPVDPAFGGVGTRSPQIDFKAQRLLQQEISMGTVGVSRTTISSNGYVSNATGFNALGAIVTSPYEYNTQPASSASRTNSINNLFGIAVGGAGYGQGPFSNTRFNMLGQLEQIDQRDPRHTSQAYADNWRDLTTQYQAGRINGSQLFTRVGAYEALNDRDRIGNSMFNFSAPPKVSFTFNSRGGGTISGTGIGWR